MNYRWMVDFDGVLANLHGAFVTTCNEKFGTAYTTDEINHWDWWDDQPTKFNTYLWRECYPDLDWTLEHLKPEEGAIEALCDLLTNVDDLADDVRVVTNRKPKSVQVAAQWLSHHLPDDLKIVIAGTNGHRKSEYCVAHRLNVAVDDHATNLRPMNAYTQKLYLVEKPYNTQELLAKVTRVPSLAAAIAHLAEQTP